MAYKKIETYTPETTEALSGHYKGILEQLGEDVDREGLLKTPERVAKAMQYITAGYEMDARAIIATSIDHSRCTGKLKHILWPIKK